MHKFTVFLTIILASVFFTTSQATAEGKATKEECVSKSKEAAKLIEKVGVEKALEKINDINGPFVWKDSYVFCIDVDTYKMIGNAYAPKPMRDRVLKEWRDANGKPVFQEFVKLSKEKGEGWVNYMHTKSIKVAPRPKTSYIMKVNGTNVLVGAGIYE